MSGFSFKPNTTRYEPLNAMWLGKAAKLAYKDENTISEKTSNWGFDKFRFFSRQDSQAFIIADDTMVLTAFRGTEPTNLKDWMTDANLHLVGGPCGKVHEGFNRALTNIAERCSASRTKIGRSRTGQAAFSRV